MMCFSFWICSMSAVVIGLQMKVSKELIQAKGDNQLFEYRSMKDDSTWNQITSNALTWMQFVLSFAKSFQWVSIVFFFSNSTSGLPVNLIPIIFKYFNSEGKFVNLHFTTRAQVPQSIFHPDSKHGIVYFCDIPDEDFLNKISELDMFDSYRLWLILKPEILPGTNKSNKLEEVLAGLNLGMNTNIIVGSMERKAGALAIAPPPTTNYFGENYQSFSGQEGTRERKERDLASDISLVIRMVQVYKAGKEENETLTLQLGYWDTRNGLFKVKDFVSTEFRWDLGGYKIHIGVKNSSQNLRTVSTSTNRFAMDVEADEEKNFMELLSCITHGINASFELVKFPKLGWRNEEGGWTHLLGGVVDETVEFALETIDVNVDKAGDMAFTHAIVTTMNNIYLHRPSSGGMRDIFMAPFSPKLVACVFTTGILLAAVMVAITIAYYHIERKQGSPKISLINAGDFNSLLKVVPSSEDGTKKWKISDAILWSISVLCMQGGQWSPSSISGNLLLINGLLFALVIYNAFAAFITSVLSVTNFRIKDLKDLADSDYAFGYTLGNSDELFLRTVNNTLLRELYFKGLKENDGVTDPIAGMHRAAKGKYAFFVAARVGRRALRTVVAHHKRCKFQELYLTATKNHASIPITRKSPLKKIVNLKIIRLMETGILRRFQKLILLTMPRCMETTTFKSAGLDDVYSAFFVLSAGWAASVIVFILEILWRKRKSFKTTEKFENNFQLEQQGKDIDLWYRHK